LRVDGQRVLSLLMRPMSPPLASSIVVAVALIVAEGVPAAPGRAGDLPLGVVYLVGVLVGVLVGPAPLRILLAVALVPCCTAAATRTRGDGERR